MRRVVLVGILTLAVQAGVASRAWAQGGWEARAAWAGTYSDSTHQDEGLFAISRGFYEIGGMKVRAVGEFRIGHEWDYGTVSKYLGGVRFIDDNLLKKWPCFFELELGAAHFTGSTDFYVEPSFGVNFPWGRDRFRFFASIGMPIFFFDQNTDVGIGGKAGFTFNLGK